MQHSIGRPTSSGRIPPRRAAARGIARPGANDNVGGTPSRRPQCRTAEQAIRRMSEEAPGDPGRHLVDALVSISPDRGRLPTDRRPTRRRKDSAVDVPLGCPLPAVLPAVSRSVRPFLTRSDPQSPSVFPTNAGFLGDFAESGTGSKPGPRRTSSSSSTCSTVHSAGRSRRARYDHDPREPESDSGLADGMVHEADGRAELYPPADARGRFPQPSSTSEPLTASLLLDSPKVSAPMRAGGAVAAGLPRPRCRRRGPRTARRASQRRSPKPPDPPVAASAEAGVPGGKQPPKRRA